MRTIEWLDDTGVVQIIDQRKLPERLEFLHIHDSSEMIQAIKSMAIRGAPALGVAGAFGMALDANALTGKPYHDIRDHLQHAAKVLLASRPTAVNLSWGLKRILKLVDDKSLPSVELPERILREAKEMAEEDVATNLRMAEYGARLIEDGDTILHHCNTGSLATVDWGTALGAIRYAFEHGKRVHVLVDETRPRFQGARLTAWECQQYGIPFEVIPDNAAGYFLEKGEVQEVMFGADRVAANGDVVNKIGTYMLSLAAFHNQVPVYPVFPTTTFDAEIPDGSQIPIEERNPEEVSEVQFLGERVYPRGARVHNPAFDITPAALISAWVTDRGIVIPPFLQNIKHFIYNNEPGR